MVNKTSVKLACVLIFRSATLLPPASWVARLLFSVGRLRPIIPQKAQIACEVTRKLSAGATFPAGDAMVTGTPRLVASKLRLHPHRIMGVRASMTRASRALKDRES